MNKNKIYIQHVFFHRRICHTLKSVNAIEFLPIFFLMIYSFSQWNSLISIEIFNWTEIEINPINKTSILDYWDFNTWLI